jgi:septum site-determining protein MinC
LAVLEDEYVEPIEEDAVPTDLPLDDEAGDVLSDEDAEVDVIIEDGEPEGTQSDLVDQIAEDFIDALMDGSTEQPRVELTIDEGPEFANVSPATDLDESIEIETTDIIELEAPVPAEAGRRVMVVEKTLRSGKTIRFAGDVMVYGDVNAGAHIEADGNIVVFGSLRGLAHAGARGDARAVIISFDLGAPQLRIADHIGFASGTPAPVEEEPQGFARLSGDVVGGLSSLLGRGRQPNRSFNPEIAWVEGSEIRIASYQGRLPA